MTTEKIHQAVIEAQCKVLDNAWDFMYALLPDPGHRGRDLADAVVTFEVAMENLKEVLRGKNDDMPDIILVHRRSAGQRAGGECPLPEWYAEASWKGWSRSGEGHNESDARDAAIANVLHAAAKDRLSRNRPAMHPDMDTDESHGENRGALDLPPSPV